MNFSLGFFVDAAQCSKAWFIVSLYMAVSPTEHSMTLVKNTVKELDMECLLYEQKLIMGHLDPCLYGGMKQDELCFFSIDFCLLLATLSKITVY